MSAAEKLKALERHANLVSLGVDISNYSDEWCAGFLLGQENALSAVALPQIVAVVEAAEKYPPPTYSLKHEMAAALAALDEILSLGSPPTSERSTAPEEDLGGDPIDDTFGGYS